MKVPLTIIALLVSTLGQSQFEFVGTFGVQQPSGPVMDIDCKSGRCLLMNGREIGITTTAGESFTYSSIPFEPGTGVLNRGQILSQELFYVAAHNNHMDYFIFLTQNGGSNWDTIFDETKDTLHCLSFNMLDGKRGYIACEDGKLIKSESQFVISDTLSLPDAPTFVSDVYVFNDTHAIAIKGKDLYETHTNGSSWNKKKSFEHSIRIIGVNNDNLLTVIGDGGNPSTEHMYRSENLGVDWFESKIHSLGHSIRSNLFFPNDSIGLAVGEYGTESRPILHYTLDGGLKWDTVSIPFIENQVSDMDLVNDSTALIVGFNGEIIRLNFDLLEPNLEDTTDSTNAVQDISGHYAINIYPNPTGSIHHIQLPINLKEVKTAIYDCQGRQISKWESELVASGLVTRDISSLESGMYFYMISNEDKTWKVRFIKQDN